MFRPTASVAKAASTAGYLAMILGLLGLLLHRSLFAPAAAVVIAQVGALALMLWARFTFGRRSFHFAADPTRGGLVTTGPYRFIRHPIYTAVCLFAWPGVLANGSLPALGLGALLTAGAVVRMRCEEAFLAERYPEYRRYAATTKRMIPHVF